MVEITKWNRGFGPKGWIWSRKHELIEEDMRVAVKSVRHTLRIKKQDYDKYRREHQLRFYACDLARRMKAIHKLCKLKDSTVAATETGRFHGDESGVLMRKGNAARVLEGMLLRVAGWAAIDDPSPVVCSLFLALAESARQMRPHSSPRGKFRYSIEMVISATTGNKECDSMNGKLMHLLQPTEASVQPARDIVSNYNSAYFEYLTTPANARPPAPRLVALGM